MQELWNHIWVVGCKDRNGLMRGMNKVADYKFYLSAQDAFDALNNLHEDIRRCFGVFEIPVLKVWELNSAEEEGKSCKGI